MYMASESGQNGDVSFHTGVPGDAVMLKALGVLVQHLLRNDPVLLGGQKIWHICMSVNGTSKSTDGVGTIAALNALRNKIMEIYMTK